jgi:hypothetical protein
MKHLMVDVLPEGAPIQLADTCRISAGDPMAPGRPECKGRSVAEPPQKGPHPDPPPLCVGTKAPSSGCKRGAQRAAEAFDSLRRELRAQLAGRP